MEPKDQPGVGDQGESQTTEAGDLKAKLADMISERDKLQIKLRELGKDSEALKSLRKQVEDLMVEKSTVANEYESFKQNVRDKELQTAVTTALVDAGAKNPDTVRRLLDLAKLKFDDGKLNQESLEELVKGIKESDPYLFKEPGSSDPPKGPVPEIRRPAPNQGKSAFELELEAAKASKDPFKAIEDLLRKHGKA